MDAKSNINSVCKDQISMLNAFEASTKLLTRRDHKDLSYKQRLDLFFIDYSLVPLLIQEN